ncbi:Oxysterol-binding protein-domain-containing protein [Lentinula raphanica]|nr:Oxysterol-binding protein-domain-containing protein [Lentinula raphanica]
MTNPSSSSSSSQTPQSQQPISQSPSSSSSSPSAPPPPLKGYLLKYTNLAKGYNTRWFVLRGGVLSYYRRQEDESVASRGAISMRSAGVRVSPSDKLRFEIFSGSPSNPASTSSPSSQSQRWYLKANHPIEANRWISAIEEWKAWARQHQPGQSASASAQEAQHTQVQKAESRFGYTDVSDGEEDEDGDVDQDDDQKEEFQGEIGDDVEETETTTEFILPYADTYEQQSKSIFHQLESNKHLDVPSFSSLSMLETLISQYITIYALRESETKRKALESTVKQARRAQKAWEESMKVVLEEEQGLEKELKRTSRNFGSLKSSRRESRRLGTAGSPTRSMMMATGQRSPTMIPDVVMNQAGEVEDKDEDADADSEDEDDEDEFFDAIESNNIPNLTSSTIAVPSSSSPSASSLLSSSPVSIPTSTFHTQYAPYAHLRTSLSLSTSRPAASLWSALKNSIGKDLTKISFPVYFNEPTSMLQRMAEDMEFSECLDIASNTPSPHLRIAYIAAFAMSNYSSTIGRIAKPFNPMLGETFEYVYLGEEGKQGYRYVSEQVSHHPPISACWAESFGWRYFGEVDAQNKFMGKSFEIRPTGVAHVELRIPKAWTVDDRASEVVEDEDDDADTEEMITEHYTWKKVTTSVSGFILGSPTIDHYGDMLITNHHTSSQCILTFKPRGWRGKDAYEIAGRVISSTGEPVYDIAGKWDSQLVMRPVHQASSGQVHGPHSQEYILLWRNTLKPAGTPFNLTPFAITLNDLPSILKNTPRDRALSLRSSLPPTDSRLRPDQRAFEMGFWDLANVLKGNQEEKQRERRRRRERELEGLSSDKYHHQPRWFRAETDGDTGERVWMPVREDDSGKVEYWVERERIWRAGKWKNVEAIFIDEPEELRDGRVLDSI